MPHASSPPQRWGLSVRAFERSAERLFRVVSHSVGDRGHRGVRGRLLHMVGPWPAPGEHHGVDGLAGAIGQVFELTSGEVDLDQQWCIAEGSAAAEWEHCVARRNGRTLEAMNAFIYRFADDRIAEMWMISTAPAEAAPFWR